MKKVIKIYKKTEKEQDPNKMKLLEDVKEILNKYYLGVNIPDEYDSVYAYQKDHPIKVGSDFEHETLNDNFLYKKYEKNIPTGWYGFSIGDPTPKNWVTAIDKVLKFLITKDPDFEIHQIKMKFGGIRFYCESEVIEDLFDIEILIGNEMHSNKLIY